MKNNEHNSLTDPQVVILQFSKQHLHSCQGFSRKEYI